MDKETRDILNIIKSGITQDKIVVSDQLPINRLIEIAGKHNIFTLVYYGLHNCNVQINDNLKNQLSNVAINGLYISEQQLYYINCKCQVKMYNFDLTFTIPELVLLICAIYIFSQK